MDEKELCGKAVGNGGKTGRMERLAAALRDNLRRRKEQQRERSFEADKKAD